MTVKRILSAALLAGSAALVTMTPAGAAPLARDPGISSTAPSNVTDVQYRRGYGFRGGNGFRRGYGYGGYRGGYYGNRGRGYGLGGAAVGLAAGAIIGGAIASSQAQAAANADAVGYCSQRYRSYDPASGTYLNNDGNRYPCP